MSVHWPRRLKPLMSLIAVALASASAAALAQEGVNTQTLRPAMGPQALVGLEGSATLEPLQWSAGMYFDYISEPLVLSYPDGTHEAIVDQQFVSHLGASLGVLRRTQVDLYLPVYLVNDATWDSKSLAGASVGDLTLRARHQILAGQGMRPGLSAQLDVGIPAPGDTAFMSADGPSMGLGVQADSRFETGLGPVRAVLNLGGRLRKSTAFLGVPMGSELSYGLGGSWEFAPGRWELLAETFGRTHTGEFFDARTSPLEMLLGVRMHTPDGFRWTMGLGGGMVGGVGSPALRGFVGLGYVRPFETPAPEAVPTEPTAPECPVVEAPYGLLEERDALGCPIPAPEPEPVCPPDPEGFEGHRDARGCAILDRDDDGVPDADDDCPEVAGEAALGGCEPPKSRAVRDKDRIRLSENVLFEANVANIKPESHQVLEEVALILRTNPDIVLVEVAGHVDNRGKANRNTQLSEERARAVRKFLVERGQVEPDRLVAKGYGATQPLELSEPGQPQPENRRVEFRILKQLEEPAAPAPAAATAPAAVTPAVTPANPAAPAAATEPATVPPASPAAPVTPAAPAAPVPAAPPVPALPESPAAPAGLLPSADDMLAP